uniref:Uncharacterized protein n=1 Tax=Chromera velia CCMP2878 TaxID=1169474 RepID=A0A0G4IC05_9ALVE|eukprot:Cvel_12995.t1-p1 / transcript=Cvel_12995.t1 / gene=Cvel_12995 / organism=Chromera_velia_CCMP2878 / gene_product=hypothetical protein / transcript_product=hypothetical protein / location=Cvel_scaffold871:47539-49216(+) / protein_length=195 / sequence_SO=supercontig / SO=protein_coding / is_pseudo=false
MPPRTLAVLWETSDAQVVQFGRFSERRLYKMPSRVTQRASDGLTASKACCGCGGGLTEPTPWAYKDEVGFVLGQSVELLPIPRTASLFAEGEKEITANLRYHQWPDLLLGGGWRLVRRVAPGTRWHNATDNLMGTDVYGTPGGPRSDSTFSVEFANENFDQFLFSFGDGSKWMVVDKSEVERLRQVNGNPMNNAH